MANASHLAKLLLDILPPSMHKIRLEMRSAKPLDLTVPQFRIIGCIFRGKNLTSEIAKHHGVSLPAMSKMVDGLVKRGLMQRNSQIHDRRQSPLHLTKKGSSLYQRVRKHVKNKLGKKIATLSAQEKIKLEQGLHQLKKIFLLSTILIFGLVTPTFHSNAGEVLTWEVCVKEASQKNPDLQASRENLQSAEFQKKAAHGGFLPQVAGNFNYTHSNSDTPSSSFSSTGTSEGSFYSTSVSATQNIFAGFQDLAKVQQGAANIESAKANLETVKAKVSFDLKSAFSGLGYAQNSLKLAQDIIHRREENLHMIELSYENGRENKGSLLLSKAYLDQARYEELLARDTVQVAQEQLAKVLGRVDPQEIHIVGVVPTSNPPAQKDITLLASTSPEYQQAIAQKKATKAAVTIARSNFFPNLNLSSSFGRQGNDLSLNTEHWSAGATLSIPIFNGGKDYYGTKSARANLRSAILNQESVNHQTRTKLEQTYNGFIEALAKLKADQSFVEAATVREAIARERYNNGLLSFEDWDIIENDLIAKQKQALQSERDRVTNEAAWEQSQGKGVLQ